MNFPTWTLQDRIRKARDHAGLNQAALADAIGVSTNSVNRWEKGDRNPTEESLKAISEATGVPVEWFYAQDCDRTIETTTQRITIEVDADGARIVD